SIDIARAGATRVDAFFQSLLQVNAGGTTEHHQVKQRVATQTVGTVYGHARHFTYGEQPFDNLVVAIGVLGNRLTMDVGGDTTHHVVASRNNRNRSDNRVNMGERLGQFTDAGQTTVQHFFTEVIKLQHHVIAIRTATVASQNFLDHGTCHDVAAGQVLGVRS